MSNALAIQILKNELTAIETRRGVAEASISQLKSELMGLNKRLIDLIEGSGRITEAIKILESSTPA